MMKLEIVNGDGITVEIIKGENPMHIPPGSILGVRRHGKNVIIWTIGVQLTLNMECIAEAHRTVALIRKELGK